MISEAHYYLDENGREICPITCPTTWPQTMGVYPSKWKADMARAFQEDGPLVFRVCQSERGWELVFCPDHLAEGVFGG